MNFDIIIIGAGAAGAGAAYALAGRHKILLLESESQPENVGLVVKGDVLLCKLEGLPDMSIRIV